MPKVGFLFLTAAHKVTIVCRVIVVFWTYVVLS